MILLAAITPSILRFNARCDWQTTRAATTHRVSDVVKSSMVYLTELEVSMLRCHQSVRKYGYTTHLWHLICGVHLSFCSMLYSLLWSTHLSYFIYIAAFKQFKVLH